MSRTIKITLISSLGSYSQSPLYPHVSKAPIKIRTRIISKMVPNDIFVLLKIFCSSAAFINPPKLKKAIAVPSMLWL
jgi:hypothetical protein